MRGESDVTDAEANEGEKRSEEAVKYFADAIGTLSEVKPRSSGGFEPLFHHK